MISITKEEIVLRLREIADGIESEDIFVNEYLQTIQAATTYDQHETTIRFIKHKDEYL